MTTSARKRNTKSPREIMTNPMASPRWESASTVDRGGLSESWRKWKRRRKRGWSGRFFRKLDQVLLPRARSRTLLPRARSRTAARRTKKGRTRPPATSRARRRRGSDRSRAPRPLRKKKTTMGTKRAHLASHKCLQKVDLLLTRTSASDLSLLRRRRRRGEKAVRRLQLQENEDQDQPVADNVPSLQTVMRQSSCLRLRVLRSAVPTALR